MAYYGIFFRLTPPQSQSRCRAARKLRVQFPKPSPMGSHFPRQPAPASASGKPSSKPAARPHAKKEDNMPLCGTDPFVLKLQDSLEGMAALASQSFDLAIADPPYGASTTATWKIDRGHALAGMGGAWKLASHCWDQLCNLAGFEG